MSAIQATDETFDPFVLIHQSVTARLQIVEVELEMAETKSRELEASLEQVRDQAEESRVVEKHLLNNLKQFSPSEVQETFANIRETQLRVERVQLEYEFLTARRAELKDQGQFLRSAGQILADLQRMYGENGSPPTAAEGDKQFRDASRQVFQIIEEERMRIARDMHDGPAQSMANLVLQAEILERLLDRNPKQLVTDLAKVHQGVRRSLRSGHPLQRGRPGAPLAGQHRGRPLSHHSGGPHQRPQARAREDGGGHHEPATVPRLGDGQG